MKKLKEQLISKHLTLTKKDEIKTHFKKWARYSNVRITDTPKSLIVKYSIGDGKFCIEFLSNHILLYNGVKRRYYLNGNFDFWTDEYVSQEEFESSFNFY